MLTLYVPSWSMRCPSAFLSDGDLAIIAATSDAVIAGAAGAPAGACPRCAQIANVSNVTKLVAAIIRITMQPPFVPYVQRRYGNRRISPILFASRGVLSTWECDGPAHGLWRLTSPTEFHPYAKGSLVEAVAAGIANAQGFHEAAGIDVVGRIGRAPNTRSRIRVMRRICDVERFDAELQLGPFSQSPLAVQTHIQIH